ncbi:MAG: hypothetical protein ACYDHW_02380 [Syntrophorhabdaceae bacterium]
MTELIKKLIADAQTMVSPIVPVIGMYLIIRGLIRLANGNDSANGGTGGGKIIIIGSFLTCYKTISSVIFNTMARCGFNIGDILTP